MRIFSQKYDLPYSVLRESLVGLVSFISGIGSYFAIDGTSSVDVSVTVFSAICPSLYNTFTAKGMTMSIQTINTLTTSLFTCNRILFYTFTKYLY